ncbi:DUF6463 family protein [Lactococcus lactis]|uniref:DUF6463 family protein n=1 Tax=Lactococcus lactis TaxID=1358 RepID=UPI00223C1118|nr:DUF6463 family protein [Lactococcus lactis]MCT0068329.1 hypothetical protein [Lactococcus lactis subsp. lactis]
MKYFYSYIGLMIIGTSVLHLFVGLLYYHNLLLELLNSRVKDDSIASIPSETSFFLWFEISAIALLLVGVLVDWLIRIMQLQLPLPFCIGFVILGILATVFAPKSGSWLILIQAALLLLGR